MQYIKSSIVSYARNREMHTCNRTSCSYTVPWFPKSHGAIVTTNNVLSCAVRKLRQKADASQKETAVHVEENNGWVFAGILPVGKESTLFRKNKIIIYPDYWKRTFDKLQLVIIMFRIFCQNYPNNHRLRARRVLMLLIMQFFWEPECPEGHYSILLYTLQVAIAPFWF